MTLPLQIAFLILLLLYLALVVACAVLFAMPRDAERALATFHNPPGGRPSGFALRATPDKPAGTSGVALCAKPDEGPDRDLAPASGPDPWAIHPRAAPARRSLQSVAGRL